jgi:hypothetical protein
LTSPALAWSEILDIDFEISNEEIISLAEHNISNSINVQKGLHENKLDSWHFSVESKRGEQLLKSVNDVLQTEYYHQLIEEINLLFTNKAYDNYHYLRQLENSIIAISDKTLRECIIKNLKENNFFFPLPSGEITDELWNWCHFINLIIKEIEDHWNLNGLYEEFKTYNYDLESSLQDKMLKHRLNVLFRNNN